MFTSTIFCFIYNKNFLLLSNQQCVVVAAILIHNYRCNATCYITHMYHHPCNVLYYELLEVAQQTKSLVDCRSNQMHKLEIYNIMASGSKQCMPVFELLYT